MNEALIQLYSVETCFLLIVVAVLCVVSESNFKLLLHLRGRWGYTLIQGFGCCDWVGRPDRGWL